MTHHSKFLKSRVEKKIGNKYRSGWCQGCEKDHSVETRLESSRRRRVDSEMRRVRRREQRHNPIRRPMVKGFSSEFQAKLYEAFTEYVYGDVMEKLTFDVELPLLDDFELRN